MDNSDKILNVLTEILDLTRVNDRRSTAIVRLAYWAAGVGGIIVLVLTAGLLLLMWQLSETIGSLPPAPT